MTLNAIRTVTFDITGSPEELRALDRELGALSVCYKYAIVPNISDFPILEALWCRLPTNEESYATYWKKNEAKP